MAIRTLKFVS
jgi:hypothetical protein